MKNLQPLVERIEADILASDLLHADGTPIRVLDRSLRDQRPWAGASPPRAVYRFARGGLLGTSAARLP